MDLIHLQVTLQMDAVLSDIPQYFLFLLINYIFMCLSQGRFVRHVLNESYLLHPSFVALDFHRLSLFPFLFLLFFFKVVFVFFHELINSGQLHRNQRLLHQ